MRTASRLHIGNIIRHGVAFNFKNWRETGVNTEHLPQAVARLFALLTERRIEYVLVGGVALLQYVEGRNTEDIDLIMAVGSLEKLPEITVSSQDLYFARGRFEELQLDILLTRHPLFAKVTREYATRQSFVERDIPCATVEGLILLKLYALPSLYRQGNFVRVGLYENDLATLMQAYRPALEPLLAELASYLSEADLASVREIVADLQRRIERFGKATNGQ